MLSAGGSARIRDKIVSEEDLEKYLGLRHVNNGLKSFWTEDTIQMLL